MMFLESNSFLFFLQFGFHSSTSMMDQLLLVYDFVSKDADEGGVTDMILFDFSKVFNVIVHSLLISKLQCLGIQGKRLQCIHSVPLNCSMTVTIDGEKVDQEMPSVVSSKVQSLALYCFRSMLTVLDPNICW